MSNLTSFKDLDKKDKVDFYIALITICCVLAFIIMYSFYSNTSSGENSYINAIFTNPQLDDEIVLDDIHYVALVEPIETRKKIKNPVVIVSNNPLVQDRSALEEKLEHDGFDRNVMLSDTVSIDEDNLSTEELSAYSNAIAEMDTISDKVAIIDSASLTKISEVDSSVIVDVETNATKDFTDEKERIAEVDNSCIIAVGLYGNKNNANRMKSRLETGGYDSFIKTRGNKYQVMVYHPCLVDQINASLKVIKANYASDAIIMVKK